MYRYGINSLYVLCNDFLETDVRNGDVQGGIKKIEKL